MKTIFLKQERELIGNEINIGDKLTFKATKIDFEEISFEKLDKISVFSIFPSISTRVCDLQTTGINEIANKFPNIDFIAISVDLPTTLREWCGSHGVNNILAVSDYKDREFGIKTGFLIDDFFLLNRGIIILNEKNEVIYLQKNKDVHQQIDFNDLERFLLKIKK
ncbi:MAG: peroxiredoxin [Metamycoplasmataceae bacterium]